MDEKLLQPLNASSAMAVTLFERLTLVREVKPENVAHPIVFTQSPMLTLVIPLFSISLFDVAELLPHAADVTELSV